MRQLGLTIYKPDKAFHGYTLFAPMTGTSAYLIDMQGTIVHRWQLPYHPGDYGYLLDNGHLLVSGQTGKGPVPFGGKGGHPHGDGLGGTRPLGVYRGYPAS